MYNIHYCYCNYYIYITYKLNYITSYHILLYYIIFYHIILCYIWMIKQISYRIIFIIYPYIYIYVCMYVYIYIYIRLCVSHHIVALAAEPRPSLAVGLSVAISAALDAFAMAPMALATTAACWLRGRHWEIIIHWYLMQVLIVNNNKRLEK